MRAFYITALLTLGIDQLTKVVVVHLMGLKYVGEIEVFPPYLMFQMAWNEGVNFGMAASGSPIVKYILIAIALAISAWVYFWIRREQPQTLGMISAGLLIGGALGNVLDRFLYGAVADFLNMSCCGFYNPYAFNVADIAIFAGAIGLILFTSKKKGA
ncbi:MULTISPECIES: signal peptidase II [Halocynthiibacter]|uniref:Lipoprotein signal peptidase n=1 Tax=Halocynthiibacter halioticoli TaxID=2986804 RepID=A0AAE3J2N3_9RHOB|nr:MULTISPECIES: signal peptidase II [Halocynthiibacter]MCV6825740.1 signal peptidase II [Halocynthiibacter halioticoli]MCW4058741.1 signal peptidase II [Halocynthiibacter sp. SDUM655004]MDE0591114.1 signal peptidase II [Halocynthiibacter sp. C4]